MTDTEIIHSKPATASDRRPQYLVYLIIALMICITIVICVIIWAVIPKINSEELISGIKISGIFIAGMLAGVSLPTIFSSALNYIDKLIK